MSFNFYPYKIWLISLLLAGDDSTDEEDFLGTVISSVNTIQNIPHTLLTNIKSGVHSYNGEGNTYMDKVENSNTTQYAYGDTVIIVERHFENTVHINDILKKYISEQQSKIVLSNSNEKRYNGRSNTAVVSFSERGNK